jgi:hypothetical protein
MKKPTKPQTTATTTTTLAKSALSHVIGGAKKSIRIRAK